MPVKPGMRGDHIIGYMMVFGRSDIQYHRTDYREEPRVNRVVW
jgi:hypothetical protein